MAIELKDEHAELFVDMLCSELVRIKHQDDQLGALHDKVDDLAIENRRLTENNIALRSENSRLDSVERHTRQENSELKLKLAKFQYTEYDTREDVKAIMQDLCEQSDKVYTWNHFGGRLETSRVYQNKILAIKRIREITGLGLRDAKDYVESRFTYIPPPSEQ